MKNDFDFIKEKFDADNLSAPDTISEDNILKRLGNKPKRKYYQKASFKAFVSSAACFALVIGIFAYALPKQTNSPIDTPQTNLQDNTAVTSFENYSDIKKAVNKICEQKDYDTEIAKYTGIAENADAVSTGEGVSASFAQTYIQVDGVDEADILKNDGKYIYYVSDIENINIYQNEKLITTITDISQENLDNHLNDNIFEYRSINDIYVNADKLIINVTADISDGRKYTFSTDSYIYDISDISNPKPLKKFTQSGNYSTSRLIGNMLYVISSKQMYNCKTEKDCYLITGENENETILPASSIKCGESINDTNCLVISAINIDTQERTADTKAFMGCSSDIYCNRNNMYIAINGEETEIIKAELTENEIKFTASAKIKGYVHNQFSMDEQNGCFRIATSDEIGNNLYILDSQLNKISEITGFAKGEQIKAVKYIGDMAYVITYEDTDPLFVIDLSDLHNPAIKGSIEITGFSNQLISVDENTLLGIGYDDISGIKLALFDISNPSSPAVLDSCTLADAYSNAQYNHKAIVVNKEKNYYAMDYMQYTDSGYETGGIVFEISDKSIHILNKHTINPTDYTNAERVTYIEDTIYILDSSGSIYSFEQ